MIGIYKIQNLINGQIYIGQSIDIANRWVKEYNSAFNPKHPAYNYPLQKDFRQFKKENFSFEIIEECKQQELNQKEKYWIDIYDSYNNGYNQTLGGSGFHGITEEKLNNIINDLENTDISFNEIALKYGIHLATIRKINLGKYYNNSQKQYPLRKNYQDYIGEIHVPNGHCYKCGKNISFSALYCRDCFKILYRKIAVRPSAEELFKILKDNNGNFSLVGRQFGVSDNAIRKWCKSYKIPYKTSDYKGYKKVGQYSLEHELIQIFDSPAQASKILFNNVLCETNIGRACKKNLNRNDNEVKCTAYGYIWEYV